MNERIEDLAEQANLKLDELPDDTFIPLEKFAELIVRECIDVVGKATASPNGYQAIMNHFGVEE